MHNLMVALTLLSALVAGVFSFVTEKGGLQYERLVRNGCHIEHPTVLTILLPQTKLIQLTQDLATSQTINPTAINSWWSSSFIHASDGNDYLIISHVLLQGQDVSTVLLRASILDINDTAYYRQVSWIQNGSSKAAHVQTVPLGVATKYFGFVSMRIWCITKRVEFNLTFQLSAPIILNGGTGTFPFGNEITFEWSMPAGVTDGHFTVNRKFLTIDSARSSTWYDRQFLWPIVPMDGPAKSNWTWFKDKPGIHQVLAASEFKPSSRQWTSSCSKATYSLDWVVTLVDGTILELSSVRDDQELCDQEGTVGTYEGYITVSGTRGEHPISGYGLVEVVQRV
ncbi:hypothetical protein BDV34DRAFT_211302 [Aspergillus parasiticus]|uniref:Hydroxyneurosporene synthase CrtC n=1 Tax=Aspergillus parasiticus TaxID=5067 RepID=A0A5N6DRT7_ASPPA|nr:hypothetical protein BDV34DRAFT_211302 [Aspergillus parasiticus]